MADLTRRTVIAGALSAGALLSSGRLSAAPRLNRVYDEIQKRHAESVERLQGWIRQPSIAAEGVGLEEGCAMMMRLATDAGFQHAERIPTDGAPSCFAATRSAWAPARSPSSFRSPRFPSKSGSPGSIAIPAGCRGSAEA